MGYVQLNGEEYWVGHHARLGSIVHAPSWQNGLPDDKVRLLAVANQQFEILDKRAARPKIQGLQLAQLQGDDQQRIIDFLRTHARHHPVSYRPRRALDLLRAGTSIQHATFRRNQEEAIIDVVEGRGRRLVVERTGWGKSFVYFIATMLLREAGRGPALLVSPLLSLMRNQIAAAERMGVNAKRVASDNYSVWSKIRTALKRDEVDILLVTPETLGKDRFHHGFLSSVAERVSLLVIDECHCISDWGHDFRPDYRLIENRIRLLPPNVRLLATTATANDRVMKDLRVTLGNRLKVQRGELARPTISLQTISLPDPSQRLAWLAEQLPRLEGNGIIYVLTISHAELVAEWLQSKDIDARAYTKNLPSSEKERLEGLLLENRVKALVATVALGMGFDKPDLAFVIHYQAPKSVVTYYQQVGRAGRAISAAYGILLSGSEEKNINEHFIRSAFPTPKEVESVIGALENEQRGLSYEELEQRVNLSQKRIKLTTNLLGLESPPPCTKVGDKWHLVAAKLKDSFWERVERLTEIRNQEVHQMREYVELEHGHMNFLIRALDGNPAGTNAAKLPPLPTKVNRLTEVAALNFLRSRAVTFDPRKMWPKSGMPRYGLGGFIPAEHRAGAGEALSYWDDGGWGTLVKQGKQINNMFDAKLVEAAMLLVRRWNPEPRPRWVTCVPSLNNTQLVPRFAKQLAGALELPFRKVLEKTEHREEQKKMANSAQQTRNIDGVFAIDSSQIFGGPVLLVDDVVGSRWTFTVSAWLLRSHGSGEVWPLALSKLTRN